jgi:hypothetical protein
MLEHMSYVNKEVSTDYIGLPEADRNRAPVLASGPIVFFLTGNKQDFAEILDHNALDGALG